MSTTTHPYLPKIIDTSRPRSTWSFQIIRNLEEVLDDSDTVEALMRALESEFNLPFHAIQRPAYAWGEDDGDIPHDDSAVEVPKTSASSAPVHHCSRGYRLIHAQGILWPVHALLSWLLPSAPNGVATRSESEPVSAKSLPIRAKAN